MKKMFVLIMICSALAVVAEVVNYPLFDQDVCFYLPFDRGNPDAEISGGEYKPFVVLGKQKYAPGLRGKALVCGKDGSGLRFKMKKNMTFDQPGTLLFFFKGVDWENNKGSKVFFTGIEAGSGYWGLQFAHGPRNICPCRRHLNLEILYSKKIPNRTFTYVKPMKNKTCDQWHMLAFSWAPGQLRINFDDQPGKTYEIPFDFSDAAFPAGGFSVGCNREWTYLIDEYTVYNRRLTPAEISQIYNQFIKFAEIKNTAE